MRGLQHLHALLSAPDTDLAALDLAGGDRGVHQPGLEILDEQARRAYRARLAELDAELTEADERADAARSDLLSAEREALLAQLAGAAGLGGRARATGSTDERARVSVRKAIVSALARIAETDPWLGRHLRDRVHTGRKCRYEPDPDHPVDWALRR